MTSVVVWGNCQARPIADLLQVPLAAAGLQVMHLPPVYLVSPEELASVHDTVSGSELLISQPVSDDYPLPGCGTSFLASLLPPGGVVVTFPVSYHLAAFPYQVHGHDGDDARVDAPLTDYHDLRVLVAAAAGMSAAQTARWWPQPSAAEVRGVASRSLDELRRRERDLSVRASDLLDGPDALWTMTHPANTVLAEVAGRILAAIGMTGDVVAPDVEYLGQRRAPIEASVVSALGWPEPAGRSEWVVGGVPVTMAELLDTQLAFYAQHPDVVDRTLTREAARLAAVGLSS